jgi:outer membrane receptor protein involved in Fe transport
MRTSFVWVSSRRFHKATLASLLGGTVLASSPALAQQAATDAPNEIVVTAQKREESVQQVPISIQALSAAKMEQHQVASFDDYAKLLPSVSFQSYGPGQSQIYFRGVTSGSDYNGAFGGSQPTSALYLDEMPLTTIGGAVDLHIYDMQRVEALSGPQERSSGQARSRVRCA